MEESARRLAWLQEDQAVDGTDVTSELSRINNEQMTLTIKGRNLFDGSDPRRLFAVDRRFPYYYGTDNPVDSATRTTIMAAQNTTIKVPSMMGGVSKSSPSKRPDQVEEYENVFLSAEEGLQKRQATKFMPLADATLKGKLDITGADPSHELIYYELKAAKNQSGITN